MPPTIIVNIETEKIAIPAISPGGREFDMSVHQKKSFVFILTVNNEKIK